MKIGIYIYEGAEVLDYSGPFEVFSTAKRLSENDWNVFLVAENDALVNTRGGLLVKPHYTFDDHPHIDVLVVVGGVHTNEMHKKNVLKWVARVAQQAKIVSSVCTGAFLLAKAGVLIEHQVTTHWEDIDDLKVLFPKLQIMSDVRWIQDANVVTSAGISAGIDMSLFLVSLIGSKQLAEKTAVQMEYDWNKVS